MKRNSSNFLLLHSIHRFSYNQSECDHGNESIFNVTTFGEHEKPDFPKFYTLDGKDFKLKECLFNRTEQIWTAYYRCKFYRKPYLCAAKCRLT